MRVHCEKCGTLYNLPDEKVSEKGTPVKCSQCGHTFLVRRETHMPVSPWTQEKVESGAEAAEPQSAEEAPEPEDSGLASREEEAAFFGAEGISVNDIALRAPEEEEVEFKRFAVPGQTMRFLGALIICAAIIVLVFYLYDYAQKTADIWSQVDEQLAGTEQLAQEMKSQQPKRRVWELYYEAEKLLNVATPEAVEEAEKKLIEAIQTNPNLPQVHAAYAKLLACQVMAGERDDSFLDKAAASAAKAVELDPDLPDGYRAMSYLGLARGDDTEALKYLAQALKRSENDAGTYLLEAKVFLASNEYEMAVDSLKNSIAANPLLFESNFLLAQLHANRKDWDKAIRYVERALSISPGHVGAQEAKESFESMKTQVEPEPETEAEAPPGGEGEVSPPSPPPSKPVPPQLPIEEELNFNTLMKEGRLLSQRGRHWEAIGRYTRALELKPTNCDARTRLGFVYLDQESIEAAKSEFETALRVSTTCADAYLGLGTIYNDLNQKEQAIQNYERYLRLRPTGQDSNEVRSILRYLREEQ